MFLWLRGYKAKKKTTPIWTVRIFETNNEETERIKKTML